MQALAELATKAVKQGTRLENKPSHETGGVINPPVLKQVTQLFVLFETWYGERWSRTLDDDERIVTLKLEQYAQILKGYTRKEAKQAIDTMRESCKHPPSPSELKEHLEKARVKIRGIYNAGCGAVRPFNPDLALTHKRTEEERLEAKKAIAGLKRILKGGQG